MTRPAASETVRLGLRAPWHGLVIALAVVLPLTGGFGPALADSTETALTGDPAAAPQRAGSDEPEGTVLRIKRGMGLRSIAEELAERELVGSATLFMVYAGISGKGRSLKAGEYLIPPGADMAAVMDILDRGETLVRRFTVPEGLTVRQILAALETAPAMTGDLKDIDLPAEGSLLPNTYHYSYGDSRADLLKRMQKAQSAVLAEAWSKRQEGLPIKTPEEALVLASIVERETALGAERPLVAGVFVNRLRKGMRLQSDPTVIYGVSDRLGVMDRPLSRRDLKTQHPHNTYVIAGLPPTPIANPGKASIEAVLNPAETDAFYFVADGKGGHAFARTLKEHNRNVAAWRKIEKQRRSAGGSN